MNDQPRYDGDHIMGPRGKVKKLISNARSATSRKQRLWDLEKQIRKNFEGWVNTGFALKEIRDDHLFKEAGYKNWTEYQNKRLALEFGIEKSQSNKVIKASVVRANIKNIESPGSQYEKVDSDV